MQITYISKCFSQGSSDLIRLLRSTFICCKVNIFHGLVVDIVAHVGFLNTSQLFGAQTCFGKFLGMSCNLNCGCPSKRLECKQEGLSVRFNAVYGDSSKAQIIWSIDH